MIESEPNLMVLPRAHYLALTDPEAYKRHKEIQRLTAFHYPRLRARMHNVLVEHWRRQERDRRTALWMDPELEVKLDLEKARRREIRAAYNLPEDES